MTSSEPTAPQRRAPARPRGARAQRWTALAMACLSATTFAAVDTFGLGDGHRGALVVATPGTVLNAYSVLVAPVEPGALTVRLASTAGFSRGDLVLLLQMGLEGAAPDSGVPGPFDLAATGVGRFEWARLADLTAGGATVTEPLVGAFPAGLTQVVSVPEYSALTVLDGGSVVAAPWDGAAGGVLAALVAGPLRNDGVLSATARGYRGGAWVGGHAGTRCQGLDEAWPGGAARGEGPARSRYGLSETGRGNVLSAGGGGVCDSSGGGGGAHGGEGGRGGADFGGAPMGGLGGGRLAYSLLERLVMGSGGGTGHCGDSRTPTSGGAGGGIVVLRAGSLEGTGRVEADGADGRNAADGAAGGGGAGGLVSLRVQTSAACGGLSAVGGRGGDARFSSGGGGGGGRILGQGADFGRCTTTAAAGTAGTAEKPGGDGEPAGPFSPGHFGDVTVLPGGLGAPPAPTILAPASLATVGVRPTVQGSAEPSATVALFVDGQLAARGGSEADGGFELVPGEALAEGTRRLEAAVEVQGLWSPKSAPVLVSVVAAADLHPGAAPTRRMAVGCGCAPWGDTSGLWATALAGWLRRRRRTGRTP